MREYIEKHRKRFVNLIESMEVTDDRGRQLDACAGFEAVCRLVTRRAGQGGRIVAIGNGGSAAIASHTAIDFWKNGRIPAMAFNDGALLTCVSNDFGYEHVFEQPIEFFGREQDVLFAVSSSGRSPNILAGCEAAKSKGCAVVTFSGFDGDNPLRAMGDYNFYVRCHEYGIVEVAHQYICHCILDTIIEARPKGAAAVVEVASGRLPSQPVQCGQHL